MLYWRSPVACPSASNQDIDSKNLDASEGDDNDIFKPNSDKEEVEEGEDEAESGSDSYNMAIGDESEENEYVEKPPQKC